ncbi:MAG: hypothetical protein UX13_C0044G0010 [Candidatus Woesebacteria bacterium GW2011_GWB1_45_5]|uniref:Uncharacterized protein n=1 Tax=Candidatus Woesebacteria bacterium GW2011_GWB1_45_5 TaxID=1618581 RepID=A0A0G1MLS4_9BACT|nr:MAG: hypothetical protein UX13_C0044G0010 [Candidatus Woesebacteria bacterium GW2011_GWB1_45_5]
MIFAVITHIEIVNGGFRITLRAGSGRELFATNHGYRDTTQTLWGGREFVKPKKMPKPQVGQQIKFMTGKAPGRAWRWTFA